jgi:hypothetical protein
MDNTIEKVLLDLTVKLVEDDKRDPLDKNVPLTEAVAFDVAVEMLQESLAYQTLASCEKKAGPVNY